MRNTHVIFFIIFACRIFSQDTPADTNRITLDQVVISANKTSESLRKISSSMAIIGQTQINMLQSQNAADLLQNTGTVFVQKSQQGGGSPVLRGFEANKVLIVVDGVRMNNAIYRGGHLQNVITLDNFSLRNVEILFGPASIVYGSDALGGVMHFYTKRPQFKSEEGVKSNYANVLARYGSINQEKTFHLDFNLGSKNFASYTSFTSSDFDDLMMGKKINPALGRVFGLKSYYADRMNEKDTIVKNENVYLQKYSGYSQLDILQKFSHKINNHLVQGLNFQLSTSSNVPRYDRLTDESDATILNQAEWYYGPQKRLMVAYDLDNNEEGRSWTYHLGAHYQKIEESRHNRRFNATTLNSRIEKLDIIGLNLEYGLKKEKDQFRLGFDLQHNDLVSSAFTTNKVNGETGKLDTRYPDGENTFTTLGIYATHTKNFNDKFTLNVGIRLGYATLRSTFIDKSFFPFPFNEAKQNNFVYSASAGIVYNPNDQSKIGLSVSSGFRVPNIDDLGKVFESTEQSVIVPNTSLKPEKTIGAELNTIFNINSKLQVNAAIYQTWLRDAIVVGPFLFNGSGTILYDGMVANVLANQNNASAIINGFSLGLNGNLNNAFSYNFTSTYTNGTLKNNETMPLDHIPPFMSRLAINFQKEKFKTTFYTIYNGWKRIKDYNPNGEDNQQYAPPEGMPSWYTINLRLSYNINKYAEVMAGIENILDLQYRTFASGINGAGRNFSLSIKGKLY